MTHRYLQAHCQSPARQCKKNCFKKFPDPSKKIKNSTHNPTQPAKRGLKLPFKIVNSQGGGTRLHRS